MNEQLKIIISAEIDKLKKGIEDAKSQVKTFKEQVKDASKNVDDNFKNAGKAIAKTAAGIAAGSTAAAVGIYKLATDSATAADEIDKMSQKIGISREAYQEWDYICSQCGVDVGVFKNGVKTLTTIMDSANSGSKAAVETFSALGLTWEDSTGKLKSQEQMMEEAITALANMEDGTERARLAQELFGKAGIELAPILNSGADGVEELRARCHELGLIMSDEAVDAGVLLGDTIADVQSTFGAIANRIGSQVMPVIQELAEKLLEAMPQIEEAVQSAFTNIQNAFNFISEHQGLFTALAIAIGVVVTSIGLYNAVAAVKAAMAAAEVTSVMALASAYAAQAAAMAVAIAPYALIVAAIGAVIAIIVVCIKHWKEHSEEIKATWKQTKEDTKEAVDKIVGFFKDLVAKVKEKVNQLKENVVNKFNEIKTGIQEKLNIIREFVSTIFEGIKEDIKARIEMAKSIIQNVVGLIKAIFTGDFGAAKTSVLNIFDAIKTGIETRINNARDKVKKAIDKIKSFFNFSWSLPKLKMPKISISGKFSLNPPSVPKFSISWNKLGGVFDKPTLFDYAGSLQGIGEDGAEAVVPLEKNTQWLDRIAEKLSAKQNGVPIVLQVDGKTFAQVSIDSINALTKQRGKLGLNVV